MEDSRRNLTVSDMMVDGQVVRTGEIMQEPKRQSARKSIKNNPTDGIEDPKRKSVRKSIYNNPTDGIEDPNRKYVSIYNNPADGIIPPDPTGSCCDTYLSTTDWVKEDTSRISPVDIMVDTRTQSVQTDGAIEDSKRKFVTIYTNPTDGTVPPSKPTDSCCCSNFWLWSCFLVNCGSNRRNSTGIDIMADGNTIDTRRQSVQTDDTTEMPVTMYNNPTEGTSPPKPADSCCGNFWFWTLYDVDHGLCSMVFCMAVIATTAPVGIFLVVYYVPIHSLEDGSGWQSTPVKVLSYLNLAHIPFIVLGNTLVMSSVVLVKRLHTPDHYILACLALVDSMTAFYIIPILMLEENPATFHLLRQPRSVCVLRSSVWIWTGASLWILMLMCLDRSVAVNMPYWYNENVTTGRMFLAIFLTVAIEVVIVVVVLELLMQYDENNPDLKTRCSFFNTPHWYRDYFVFVKIGLQLLFCVVLSVQVYVKAIKELRHLNRTLSRFSIVSSMKMTRKMASVKVLVLLCFFFLFLWLPTLAVPLAERMMERNNYQVYQMIANHMRIINSSINAIVYALSREVYKVSYKYLLTTPPCEWKHINDKLKSASYAWSPHPSKTKVEDTSYHYF